MLFSGLQASSLKLGYRAINRIGVKIFLDKYGPAKNAGVKVGVGKRRSGYLI